MEKDPKKDTLWLWFKPKIEDSLKLIVKSSKIDTFKINFRKIKEEKWEIKTSQNSISPTEQEILFSSNIPIASFEKKSIHIINKDSSQVDFSANFTPNTSEVLLKVPVKEGERYKLTALGAFTNFYEQKSDTLQESFTAKRAEDFAKLNISIKDSLSFPIIIELTDKGGNKVLYSQYVEQPSSSYSFPFIKADTYLLRIIEDKNRNKKWDTGNFLLKKQPENIRYFAKEIELRANWEIEQEITFENP